MSQLNSKHPDQMLNPKHPDQIQRKQGGILETERILRTKKGGILKIPEITILSKQQVKDGNAWLDRSNLTEQRIKIELPKTKSDQIRDYDFNETFSKDRLKEIKETADRGGFKGLGDFKKIIEQAQDVHKLLKEYREGKKHKKGILSKGKEVSSEWLIDKFNTLIGEANEWLEHLNEVGKDTEQGADQHRKAKIKACHDLIAGANLAIMQLRGEFEEDFERLKDLKERIDSGKANPEEFDEY